MWRAYRSSPARRCMACPLHRRAAAIASATTDHCARPGVESFPPTYIVMHCGRRALLFFRPPSAHREGTIIPIFIAVHERRLCSRARMYCGLISLVLALTSRTTFAQDAPLSIPLHDPAYIVLDGLENAGCATARVSAFRPFTVPQVRAAMRAAADDPMCPRELVTVLRVRFDPEAARSSDIVS